MEENDFSKGSIAGHIVRLSIPMIVAQLINVLYNIIDRIYIGRIPLVATEAMSGLGLCLPITTIIMAFANLFGMGGAPLCSIARGEGRHDDAEEIMSNAFVLLILCAFLLMAVGFLFKEPILWAFGASSETFPYANSYITVYLYGTLFVMIELGLNSFINGQGFSRMGMLTVLLGAVTNIILDPIFIFVLSMGVTGAALATVISQFISAVWTLYFLTSKRTILKLKRKYFKLKKNYVFKIISLGTAGFMQSITNSIVTIVCNSTLSYYGGDIYIAIMTIINSIREVASLPGMNIANAMQPVIGYNYGAKCYDRVLSTIKFVTVFDVSTMVVLWLIVTLFPGPIFSIFSTSQEVISLGASSCRLYFFGFFMMSFQMVGQSVAIGLGKSGQAIFFSIFRKIIIVVPLTLILPRYIGINGVFIAEAISNFIGGAACYITMWLTIGKKMSRLAHDENKLA